MDEIGPAIPQSAGSESSIKPTRAEAEAAIRTLIRWAGDEPDREGLRDTPGRVVRSYLEFFDGYSQDPVDLLETDV